MMHAKGKHVTGTDTTSHMGMMGMMGMKTHLKTIPKHLVGHPLLEDQIKQADLETHNFLGDSGIKVSKICLGTMNFGQMDKKYGDRPGQLNEQEAHKILGKFVELGGNFIDTANFYPWFGSSVGESEKIIGTWLQKQQREKIILCTKVCYPMDFNDPNAVGLSRNHIFNSVNQSLNRLKTDYIDLLSINGWDDSTSISDVLRTMEILIKNGKVRHIGCVDLKAWQLQTTIDLAKTMGMDQFISVSTEYNLLNNGPEMELVDVCRTRHCSLLAYSPLKGGYLTSKITPTSTRAPDNTRISAITNEKSNISTMTLPFDEMSKCQTFKNTLETVHKIAKKHNKTVSQVALRWLLQKDVVCSVIVGVKTVEQLEENMGALKFSLDCEDMDELDKASIHNVMPTTSTYTLDTVLKLVRSREYYTTNWNLLTGTTGKTPQKGTQGLLQGTKTPTTLTGTPTTLTGTTKQSSGTVTEMQK